jgi:hypothetical protein
MGFGNPQVGKPCTEKMINKPPPDLPLYEIRIKGHLDAQWMTWFDGLTITLEENGDTLLSGPVADQSALHGLLRKVRDLGMPLVSVAQVHFNETHPKRSKKEMKMNENIFLNQIKQIGVGLAFIIFPLLFVFAFAVHPDLLQPHLLGPEELIRRAHANELLQFGHVLVTLSTGLLIVVALHFMKLLERSSGAWAGFIGAAIAILGTIVLAADKGALCLTMSAFDTLPEKVFAQIMPGVLAMFTKQGWLVLLWSIVFLPIGFAIQAVALLKTNTIPRWQSTLFLIGVLLVATPDGLEIINLSASILMAIAFVPYGIRIIRGAL